MHQYFYTDSFFLPLPIESSLMLLLLLVDRIRNIDHRPETAGVDTIRILLVAVNIAYVPIHKGGEDETGRDQHSNKRRPPPLLPMVLRPSVRPVTFSSAMGFFLLGRRRRQPPYTEQTLLFFHPPTQTVQNILPIGYMLLTGNEIAGLNICGRRRRRLSALNHFLIQISSHLLIEVVTTVWIKSQSRQRTKNCRSRCFASQLIL